jgi:hypothetical protein
MRIMIFLSGALIIGFGALSFRMLERDEAFGFLHGALTLGGAIIISGLFSLRMQWHGYIAAGILALLGAARGFGNLPDLASFWVGERERGVAPLLELGVTLICLSLLLRVIRSLAQERLRRMLEDE